MGTKNLFSNIFLSALLLILINCGGSDDDRENEGGTTPPPPPKDIVIQSSFGSVPVGSTLDNKIEISTKGILGMSISKLPTPPAPFSIVEDNCSDKTIRISLPCTFDIRFTPVTAGTFNHSFDVPTNAANKITINISGTGIASSSNSQSNSQLPAPTAPANVIAIPGNGQKHDSLGRSARGNFLQSVLAYQHQWDRGCNCRGQVSFYSHESYQWGGISLCNKSRKL